jgi:phospholipid/cholesterol/gamma-HCH transport system substrate-binding protein
MISSHIKKQLAFFTTMAVAAVLIIVFGYAHIPTVMGIGQMNVTAYFQDGAGIYVNSNVTTRGVSVGKVTGVSLTPQGVAVTMRLPDGTRVGADARAEIHSVSAVGEQYVDLVSNQPGGPNLQPGAIIPISRTTIPEQIAPVLDKATNLLASVPNDGVQTFLDEGDKAFQNLGPDLRTLVDSSQSLIDAANSNYAPTATLINTLGPLLDTQNQEADHVRFSFRDLEHFTGVLRDGDKDFRGAIRSVRGAAGRAGDFLDDNENSTPILSHSVKTLGDLTNVYRRGLEQVLVAYPLVEARLQRLTRGNRGARVGLAVPVAFPNCTEGFKQNELRNPNDLSDKDAPPNTYCKIPHDAQRFVHGARNIPCLEGHVGMRAALVSDCLGDTRTPGSITSKSNEPGQLGLPNVIPNETGNSPLAGPENQRFYPHQQPGSDNGDDFEPLSQLGGQGTPSSGKEASWQSLLAGPLND